MQRYIKQNIISNNNARIRIQPENNENISKPVTMVETHTKKAEPRVMKKIGGNIVQVEESKPIKEKEYDILEELDKEFSRLNVKNKVGRKRKIPSSDDDVISGGSIGIL